jgi:hypothetical protein
MRAFAAALAAAVVVIPLLDRAAGGRAGVRELAAAQATKQPTCAKVAVCHCPPGATRCARA